MVYKFVQQISKDCRVLRSNNEVLEASEAKTSFFLAGKNMLASWLVTLGSISQ